MFREVWTFQRNENEIIMDFYCCDLYRLGQKYMSYAEEVSVKDIADVNKPFVTQEACINLNNI